MAVFLSKKIFTNLTVLLCLKGGTVTHLAKRLLNRRWDGSGKKSGFMIFLKKLNFFVMFRMSPGSTVWLMVRCLKYEEKIIKVLLPNEFFDVQKNLSTG